MNDKKDKQQWLEARRSCIGSSDWAPILGYDPYRTALDVYVSKVWGVEQKSNDIMAFGLYVEDFSAQLYSEKTGQKIGNYGATAIQIHPDYDWLGVTLDRYLPDEGNAPLELKSVNSPKIRYDEWWCGPPLHYQIQLQAQIACTGADFGCLVGLFFPWVRLAWCSIARNDRFISRAIPKLERFWNEQILAKVPPEPTYRDLSAVKQIYPRDDGETVILSEDDLQLANELDLYRDQKKDVVKKIEHTEAQLRHRMCNATYGALPDGTYLTAKTQRDGKRPLKRWRP